MLIAMRSCRVGITILAVMDFGSLGCGRIGFESTRDADTTDASPCVGIVVDVADDDPTGALSCSGAGCSLRSALAQANTRATSTICVADDLSITLATPLLVTSDVSIVGSRTAICGAGASRLFRVGDGGALRLRDLTLCHGRVVDDSGAAVRVDSGGALFADGVVFDDHTLQAETVSQEGGAVFAAGDAIVELRRSRFTNNRAISTIPRLARGGAFGIRGSAAARIVFEDTAFEDNVATDVGGALFIAMAGTGITMERLLFARNNSNTGSAIDINCASTGTIAVGNSTFADNVGASTIFVCGSTTVRLSFCSFRSNSELVRLDTAGGRAEWRANAIESTVDLCSGSGIGVSLDGNVATQDGAVCPLDGATDRLQSPLLAVLADNGGPTHTLALLAGSPAIDAAGNVCPSIDQRGLARPARTACDAGAFEAQ